MNFFGIIFYIFIILIFVNAKKAAQSGNNHRKEGKRAIPNVPTEGKEAIPNVTIKGKSAISNEPTKRKEAIPNVPVKRKEAIPNVPTKGKEAVPNVTAKGKSAIPNVPRKNRRDKSFLEPHQEEHYQPQIRTNNLWGEDEYADRRIVALRLMEGDPVPAGYTKIKCPYCAADNLVTKHCKQYHSCYFCRVPID